MTPSMFPLYRFSPIKDKETLFEAIEYVAREASALCKKLTGVEYPITNLTVFSHYLDEFVLLSSLLQENGTIIREKNGPVVRLHQPFIFKDSKIPVVRIRILDPYRAQVGCCDFDVPDFQVFKDTFLARNPNNLRSIPRTDYEMIEFFDPDIDVLAYVLSVPLYP